MNKIDFIEKTTAFSKTLDIDLVKKLVIFDEINSTNLKAKELAQKNADEGTIVISKIQKKGRGRFDRTWESPEGGLYFSIVLKPDCKPDKTTLLPLVGALSVCKTITSITDLNVKIKWPNDVLINGKKVSGILLESESGKNLTGNISILPDETRGSAQIAAAPFFIMSIRIEPNPDRNHRSHR